MSRRMFSDNITSSDAFLEMPDSTQNLYFHLGMSADDDGFIGSPKMIMRVIRAKEDDYKLLIAKKFILHFEKGICVVKHWRINNQIRKDRYTATKYLEEKTSLFIKENGAYTQDFQKGTPVPKGHFTIKILEEDEPGNQLATTRQPSIGKVSIGKVSKVKKAQKLAGEYEEVFESFWVIYPEKVGKGKAYEVWLLLTPELKTICVNAITNQVANRHFFKDWLGKDSAPHPTTWLNQRRWEDIVKPKKGPVGKNALVDDHTDEIIANAKSNTVDLS